MEVGAPKEEQGWEELQARNLGLVVGISTGIQGLGTSESSVGSACLWKWRSDK